MAEPNQVGFPQGKPYYQFNGLNSNNSSRGASPVPRAGSKPVSQLPPARGNIPASQLPPNRSSVPGLTQKIGQLSVSGSGVSTPNFSPNKFSTSTPNQVEAQRLLLSEIASPVVPNNRTLSGSVVSEPHPPTIDIINKNVSDNSENNLKNSVQVNASSASQYFSQAGSFDLALNGQGNPALVNNQHDAHYSQGNMLPALQQFQPLPNKAEVPQGNVLLQNRGTIGSIAPQNIPLQQTTKEGNPGLVNQHHPSYPQSQGNVLPAHQQLQPLANKAEAPQGNTISQSRTNQLPQNQSTIGRITPQNIQLQQQAPPGNNLPQTSDAQSYFNQTRQSFRSNPGQMQPQFQAFPQNMPPNYPQPISSAISQPVPTPNPNFSQPQRPRYPQTVSSNVQNQNVYQGLPQMPRIGLPPAPFSKPSGQLGASQRFDPQINYNVGPPMAGNALPPPPAPQQSFSDATRNGPPGGPQIVPRPSPAMNKYPSASGYPQTNQQYPQSNIVQSGFNRIWGNEQIDLLQTPNILPPTKVNAPKINLGQQALDQANCSAEVFRSTITKIPESASLLQKSRLPLGLLIHPFKDLSYLPVIQCNVIVRCRACRTYINPFVYFVDSKRWKCNLCYRVNELPEEFQYDPVSKSYGDPSRRPEIKSSTIEYIAPAEYMLRPPQPAVYLFLLDVSRLAIESGYLEIFCGILLQELKNLPGDLRTQVGFLTYDSAVHFFSLAEGLHQPHEMTILDIDDVFLPTPDNLLVNLRDRMELVEDLLNLLPKRFGNTFDGNSALGAALQVAHKMMGATGGRVSVFQASLPNVGPGAVTSREDPNQRSTAETSHLNPVNDFYKRLALECSGQQIAVDLFLLNSQYVDIATISGISRFSGGCLHHFPLFKSTRPFPVDEFQKSLTRYLTRKIGFEAVMRVRCTRGLTIHTFHGNFFVRSMDLLSLPNISPDSAFGMQVAIEENLSDCQSVCFQAALLYTSSKGERRIRVHTLCLPIASTLHEIIQSADQQCIIGLLGKMAVDRSMQSSLSDARDAFINVAIDVLSAYKVSLNMGTTSALLVPECLKLLPLYISAILKHPAFRIGLPTRLDDRVKAMMDMKTKPLYLLMQQIYPDMYAIHNLQTQQAVVNSEEEPVPMPPRLQLTARSLENKGAFLMDCGDQTLILVSPNVPREFLTDVLGVPDYGAIPEVMVDIPILENVSNQRLHLFINYLNDDKPYPVPLQVIRDNSPTRVMFLEKLIEDRLENSLSYHEFLQHLKSQVK